MSSGELGSTQANLRGPRREPPRVEPSLPYTRHCVPYRVLTRSEMRERVLNVSFRIFVLSVR